MSVLLLDTEELTALFGYKNERSTWRAMSRGTFPVKTYKLGRTVYAKKNDVRAYFQKIVETETVSKGAKRRETNRRLEHLEQMKELEDDVVR